MIPLWFIAVAPSCARKPCKVMSKRYGCSAVNRRMSRRLALWIKHRTLPNTPHIKSIVTLWCLECLRARELASNLTLTIEKKRLYGII